MDQGCLRTVAKATYLLLEKYHRRYGLKVFGWAKAPGNYYLSFYLGTDRRMRPGMALPDLDDERLTLTLYQDHIGVPAWAAGEQWVMLDAQMARTHQVMQWLESRLTLAELFRRHAADIADWRRVWTVDDSERYLLTWQVAGLLSQKLGAYLLSPRAGWCDVGGVRLSERASAQVPGVGDMDLWAMYCQGASAADLAKDLYDQADNKQQDRANDG